jgi:hypothetical protein
VEEGAEGSEAVAGNLRSVLLREGLPEFPAALFTFWIATSRVVDVHLDFHSYCFT